MIAEPKRFIAIDEYLAFERTSETKHEYLDGAIYAMSGGSACHNRIIGNTYAALHAQMRKHNCTVYPSDMRIKVVHPRLYTYPDITVVCGTEQFEDEAEDVLLNPIIIIEVLSPSTEKYDRGKKFQYYRTIFSLREHILIAQDECHIERFIRQSDNTWVLSEATSLDESIELTAVKCNLHLADVYEKVVFPAHENPESIA